MTSPARGAEVRAVVPGVGDERVRPDPSERERVVTTVDAAEAAAVEAGRSVSEVARLLERAVDVLAAGWSGRAGDEAVRRAGEAHDAARAAAGRCLYVADVLRVEGSALARALVGGGDDDEIAAADAELARRLDATDLGGQGAPAGPVPLDPAVLGDPRALAGAWHDLPGGARARLLAEHPELGGADGLPAVERDVANRERLGRWLESRTARVPAGGTDPATNAAALEAVRAYVNADPRRLLLAVDPGGRAVVAEGDPDRAGRVVTFVPGTGSSAATLGETGGRGRRVCAVAGPEGAGSEGSGSEPGAEGGCVPLTWQGYDAPQSLVEAGVSTDRATAHAGELRALQEGLDAVDALDGVDAPSAVIGYSYGSVVVGAAAADPRGLATDRMVHVGSPGATVDSIAEQFVATGGTVHPARADEVVSVASRWDPVPWWSATGVLGGRPGSENFGGIRVDVTEPGVPLGERQYTHSRYFSGGTASLGAIARAVAGESGP